MSAPAAWRPFFLALFALFGLFAAPWALAQPGMVQLDVGRGDARLPVYVMPQAPTQAVATLILLPGGDAGTGKIVDGQPGSGNFLSRSRADFHAAGFHVLVAYRASDRNGLDYGERIGQDHVAELAQVIAYARQRWDAPIWLVGTSRGSISATAAAIALGPRQVQGLVLSASVTSQKPGAIATQDIANLQIPVLVLHHKRDACRICVPDEASRITAGLKSAPVKKFILIEGGANPEGNPCGARHWHGFIGHEKETVQAITDWIKNPQD